MEWSKSHKANGRKISTWDKEKRNNEEFSSTQYVRGWEKII